MKRLALYILLYISALQCFAQEETDTLAADSIVVDTLPSSIPLHQRIDSIMAKSKLTATSQLGMMVYDLDSDSIVYAYGERQNLRPASTMKLLTAVTALDKLGGSYQFRTRLRYSGEVVDSVRTLAGDVFLVGGMDPRFGHDDLVAFVESIRKLGIDTIQGDICSDRSMKQRDLLGEGWCWDDDNPVLSPLVYGRKDQMGSKFLELLRSHGIVVKGTLTDKTAPKDSKELCMRSHTIDQILMRMMKESDNLYAESMLYNIGGSVKKPATAKGAAEIENALIRRIGLTPSDYRIADGSGLSLYNYVSPELEVMLLRYAYNNKNIFNHLYPSLPVAGSDGTLSKRMRGTSAAGNVHAKTGTLTGISSLAGYLTAPDGHTYAFCIINQGIRHTSNAKRFQDSVCVALTK